VGGVVRADIVARGGVTGGGYGNFSYVASSSPAAVPEPPYYPWFYHSRRIWGSLQA